MEPPSSTSTTMKKKISLEDFEIKRIIGKGSYGDVFLVTKESQPYAMKEIIKRKLQREKKEYQAMVERELLRCMKHPGIIKLKYAFQDKNKLYFIMEYCHLGEFVRFMKEHIDHFTEEVRKFYIAEMVNLLEYLHINGITHRDLKPQNLLLSKDGHLKLVDFGTSEISQCKFLSQEFKDGIEKQKDKEIYGEDEILTEEPQQEEELMSPRKRRSTFVGTSYYISPELLEQNVCEPPSDLWALGCIIYQLYYLETPFKDTTEYGVFEKIKKVQLEFPKNDIINEHAIDLIKKLLIKIPEERLGSCSREELDYKHLKKHPYFDGIDVDKVYTMVPPDIEAKKYTLEMEEALEEKKKDFTQLAVKVLDESDRVERMKMFGGGSKEENEKTEDKEKEKEKEKQEEESKEKPKDSINEQTSEILYEGMLEKREFPYYEHCYMRLYSSTRRIKLVKLDRPETIETLELEKRKYSEPIINNMSMEVARIIDEKSGKFYLETKERRREVFRAGKWCKEWVQRVNELFGGGGDSNSNSNINTNTNINSNSNSNSNMNMTMNGDSINIGINITSNNNNDKNKLILL